MRKIIALLSLFIFFLAVFLYDVKTTSLAFLDIFSVNNLFDQNNIAPLITVVGSIFAYFSIVIVNFGDGLNSGVVISGVILAVFLLEPIVNTPDER